MRIISWNLAGIRACVKKGLFEFMNKEKADIYCFQEVKSSREDIPNKPESLKEYQEYHVFSEKKGYSGVSVYTRVKPITVLEKTGIDTFDKEGRVLVLEFEKFFLINAYFPHANRELTRLDFKLDFNKKFSDFAKKLETKKPLIIASDFNVAHKEIDLKNFKQNKENAGFTSVEREWLTEFLSKGFVDTFRYFCDEAGHYTWWTYMNNARERNIGWRIDYFLVSDRMLNNIKSSKILKDILGSDHCPIFLELN